MSNLPIIKFETFPSFIFLCLLSLQPILTHVERVGGGGERDDVENRSLASSNENMSCQLYKRKSL